MENMRDLLRRKLASSLHNLPEFDRLDAAWPLACGLATARHGQLTSFHDGVLEIVVTDPIWLTEMVSRRSMLQYELIRIAAVPLTAIHFRLSGQRSFYKEPDRKPEQPQSRGPDRKPYPKPDRKRGR